MATRNRIIEKFNVTEEGYGPKKLVLAHGFGTSRKVWQRLIYQPDLIFEYKVIRYDLACVKANNFNFDRYTNLYPIVEDLFLILDALDKGATLDAECIKNKEESSTKG